MITETPVLTLAEIYKMALPLGTTIVAGGGALARQVRWAVTVDGGTVNLPYLEGDELVLAAPGEGDLTALVKACAEHGAAAVASPQPMAPTALVAAEMADLPVFQLPAESRIREIERLVIGLLLDHNGHTERRGAQIYQQLVQLASDNAGLDKIVHSLARYIGKGVVVQDKNLRPKFNAAVPALAHEWDSILETLKDRRLLPEGLRDRHRLPRHTAPGVQQALGQSGLSRVVAPIINQGIGRGYLSFITLDSFDDVDMLVLKHGTVICALEMARAKAISEVEKKLRGDFLTSLMGGTISEAEAQAEGDRFGHDMNAPHIALVATWYGPKRPSSRRLETLVNGLIVGQSANLLSQLRETELRLFYAPESSEPVQAARHLAEEIRKEVQREYKDAQVAIGIGSLAKRIWEWRISYREAAHAADIARRLQSDTPLFTGDLGIYTLLARADFRDDLRALRDKMIGNLLKYEERQRADLLQTLEAFFQCHGNHTQTAEILSVHRNTLFYRMNRIAEITGLDLNQPDVRLAVHLSLKIHRLLSSEP